MKNYLLPLFAGLLCMTVAQAATPTLAYDAGKNPAENGTALQAAINAASSGDELKVQAGTYIGNFTMKEGVQVSGGWNEGFTAQTDYATILDANASGRVLHQAAAFSTLTVWSNLTIQNGKFTAQQTDKAGSGVFLCDKGQVKHCLIQNNLFDAASGEASGGGVYENGYTTSVLVDDCIIRGNTASHGGGVRICGVIQNSIIENNTTTINACGGVQLHYGGAMYNCIVRNNTGKDSGGVRLTGDKACTIANCLIISNTATGTVGGLQMSGNSAHNVYNCTIVGNNQKGSGNESRCGVHVSTGSGQAPNIINNIVWGNTVNSTAQTDQLQITGNYNSYAATHFLNNAIVRPSSYGTGTILLDKSTDPGFTDAANGDYSLLYSSSLRNQGNNDKATGSTDLAGLPRIVDGTVDIGAYECQWVEGDRTVKVGENLQNVIDHTFSGNTVKVQAGTFYGNFTMKDGVNVSGGWNADFNAQTDYATILDAQESGRVVNQPSNFSNPTIWENLTIQHGKLTASMGNFGSGVYLCKNGQVKNCVIQNNAFTYSGTCQGGGVANDTVDAATDVLVDNCIIQNNSATHGAGLRIRGTIQNSIVRNNATTNNAGGGIHLQNGRAVNCQVYNNAATSAGGIRAIGNAAEVLNCEVYNNTASSGAPGGVLLANGACMYNSIIRDNTTGNNAGGVRLTVDNGNDNASTVANCLIANNSADGKCGGVSIESNNGSATKFHKLYGNTIVGNSQGSSDDANWCGIRQNVGGPVQICNNIVWGNKANGEVQSNQVYLTSSYKSQTNNFVNNALVWNSKLSDGTDWTGKNTIILTEDPFIDAANGNYYLNIHTAADLINSGNNDKALRSTDLAGNGRKQGNVDRGCYEQTKYSRDVTEGNFGTICLPFAVAANDVLNAKVYKVLSFATDDKEGLLLEEVNTMEAGKPYFFASEASNIKFRYVREGVAAAAGNENGLYGTIEGETVSGEGLYVLQNNMLCHTYNVTTSEAIVINLAANRAYLKFSEVPDFGDAAPSPKRRVIAIQKTENTATGVYEITNSKSCKIIIDGQLLIIRDGKVYNVLGL